MNTTHSAAASADDSHWPDLLVANYPLVEEVVKFIARRHRLRPDEADELGSLVRFRLVEDNYRVLRTFQHRSSIRTYLTTVITRIWLDQQVACRGKWRPSATARRQGDTAVRLERLLFRDRLSFGEACETLRQNVGVPESVAQLDRLRGSLRTRRRPAMCSLEDVDATQCVAIQQSASDDPLSMTKAIGRALFHAMEKLSVIERQLLTLRFVKGWTVSRIARHLSLDSKATYRQFTRIYRTLKASIEEKQRLTRTPRTRTRFRSWA